MKRFLTKNQVFPGIICLLLSFAIACKKDKTIGEPPAPSDVIISDISINKGTGLTTVVITGSGFSNNPKDNKVTFNGIPALVQAATATSLTVVVPAKAGTGKVKVQVGDKIGVGPDFEYVYTYMVSTLAGQFQNLGYKDGLGESARFNDLISGMRVAPDGNLYVVDQDNIRIRKVTPEGGVSTFVGNGIPGIKNGNLLTAQFNTPIDIVPAGNNIFYITDASNNCIRKIENQTITTFAGSTYGSADGQGLAAKFTYPSRITLDKDGTLYVADVYNYSIRKITPSGMVSTFVGGTSGYADGKGTSAKLSLDFGGMTTDSKGNLYVADANNQCIRKITPDGTVTTYAGAKDESASIDGDLTKARFILPSYLATDANDNIYVSDLYKIRKITPAGIISTVAGTGQEGSNDGAALQAQFNTITSLAVTSDGNTLYVSDSQFGTIRKVEAQ